MEFPEVLTPDEVARVLRVQPITVRRMLRRGELRGWRVGAVLRVDAASVRQLLDPAP